MFPINKFPNRNAKIDTLSMEMTVLQLASHMCPITSSLRVYLRTEKASTRMCECTWSRGPSLFTWCDSWINGLVVICENGT